MPSAVFSTLERLVRVEVNLENLSEKIHHIDLCVDDLKRTIWKASGAVTICILVAGWIFKHL